MSEKHEKHERAVEPFSDLHVEDGHVRATLLHDPTVEGLDVALYLDGSGSMRDEFAYPEIPRTFLEWLMGEAPKVADTNQVEHPARWMLEYLASKDRNGQLRVGYWACGGKGNSVEILGELSGAKAQSYKFPGPKAYGAQTNLAPAVRDFVQYLKAQVQSGAKRGCAVFVTDGQIHDVEDVEKVTEEIAKEIRRGRLPRVNFVLVGVGSAVDEEQLEHIAHTEHASVGHLWCHRVAAEIKQVAELVAVLVDETMTVAAGGTVWDDKGNVLKEYEGRLPAVLEFEVPEGCESFTLEVNGQRFTQPLPEHDDDDGDHH
ncbi:MAG: vWA domain-containing protein [Sandaracinus sp.]